MNAAKKIRRFIEENKDHEQVQVLKDLAAALEMGRPFDLGSLYQIDMRYFEVALDLLKDWRFDHHIAARSKLLEQLLTEIAPDLRVDENTSAAGGDSQPAAQAAQPVAAADSPAAESAPVEAEAVAAKPARSRRKSSPAA
ncbi:hypothetical protein EAY64_01930 [Aquitalea palustris]|uniref:Uncharacterized protein n=1 Tax=Aquitalea palustris TaxID=2480983 RepID=A0A454JN15_9NEIS|nr:hypothetical protein [Aquitalea palustris]RMD01623.1 hypothetical protein EAY64_01930 [Aquitalea palustris]